MSKKIILIVIALLVIGVLVVGAVNRTLANNGDEDVNLGGYGRGRGGAGTTSEYSETTGLQDPGVSDAGNRRGQGAGGYGADELASLPAVTPGELSHEEIDALLYMREEEKLAHDVYVTLYANWSLPIFQNISQSEQVHTEAIKTLIDRYGLSDPAVDEVGIFANTDLQAIYDNLVSLGSQSLADALKVSAAVEEIDILDLQKRLGQADNADIQQVFTSLLKGSENHLRAFTAMLQTQAGESYQPQHLTAEAYQAIIDTGTRSSGRGGSGERNGQGGYRGGRP
jgi:hypothetical protein